MGFRSWILGKGLADSIANDLLIKYLAIKRKYPKEEEKLILERVWNFWITLNEGTISKEDSEDKVTRLEIIKNKHEENSFINKKLQSSLFKTYQDVLYIEAEILSTDGKLYKNCLKVFLNKAEKLGLDYKQEYDSYLKTIGYLGL